MAIIKKVLSLQWEVPLSFNSREASFHPIR